MKDSKFKKPDLSLIKIKSSKIHGKGIYARKNISKGTRVIEYVGEIISKKEGNKRAEKQYKFLKKNHNAGAVYVFELDKKHDLDGNVRYNIARFINHSCNPNCRYKIENSHIWITAIKNIKKGDEITYDYGYDLEDYKNHKCRCNSNNCMGYIIGKRYRKNFEI